MSRVLRVTGLKFMSYNFKTQFEQRRAMHRFQQIGLGVGVEGSPIPMD